MADFRVGTSHRFGANARFEKARNSEPISEHDIVVKGDDGTWSKANAGDTDLEDLVDFGIACNDSVAVGQPLWVCTWDDNMTVGFTVAIGTPIYLSQNADGAMAPAGDLTSGDAIVPLAEPISTTKVIFNPRPTGAVKP